MTQSILTTTASSRVSKHVSYSFGMCCNWKPAHYKLLKREVEVYPTLAPEKMGLVSSVASGPNLGLLEMSAILSRQLKS